MICSCEKPKDISENEIYKILNQLIVDNKIGSFTFSSLLDTSYLELNGINEFSEYDNHFFTTQLQNLHNLKISNIKINEHIFQNISIHKINISSNLDSIQVTLSYPFISADRKKAILSYHYYGDFVQYLYIQKNGNWIKAKELMSIME
jgi:hypothetical protein